MLFYLYSVCKVCYHSSGVIMASFIIVDDHPLLRLAVRNILEKENHSVLAEASDGNGLVKLLLNSKTDILILDIDMPGPDGIEIICDIRQAGIHIPIIVISGKNASYYAPLTIKSGANGFISKKNGLDVLLSAVNAAISGYGYFPFPKNEIYNSSHLKTDAERLQTLSRREFEILHFLGGGRELISIANQLKISTKTVSTYKARLMQKLALKNHYHLLDFTRRNNIN